MDQPYRRFVPRATAVGLGLLVLLLVGCAKLPFAPSPTPPVFAPNLDADTLAMMARADRIVFVIPFSHWDTDWHETFASYSQDADNDILAAIAMAKQSPQFRYTLEQVLFVQHVWQTHPEARADLSRFVQNRQFTFAWGGITQPETSLVAPAIQEKNLELGRQWISDTFGAQFIPHTAWQSDAFGNSAAFPLFLTQHNIPYLFIGRMQGRCDPTFETCQTLPAAFDWRSPASDARVLVDYISYPSPWDAIHRLPTVGAQVSALRDFVTNQYTRTTSKYLFLPMGSDFQVPLVTLLDVLKQWNAQDPKTVLVMADPETAFRFLDTQNLPEITIDLNPTWQGFYASRPYAKIADKDAAFYLTALDRFRAQSDPASPAWYTATISAHYDNIGAVSFDQVWEQSQEPRFEETVARAASDLANVLTRIAQAQNDSMLVFNPSDHARSGVVETSDGARYVTNVSAASWSTLTTAANIVPNPVSLNSSGDKITLSNSLVQLTLDASKGGTLSSLKRDGGAELLTGAGDDIVYYADTGDIYGARFGAERARSSAARATASILEQDPLLTRVQYTFALGDQPITKTVTLRANEPQVELTLELAALPESTAVVQTPNSFKTDSRTDDLGFIPFTHKVDTRPIEAGDLTYRRKIFYPIIGWSDLRLGANELSLLTHGIQNIAGTDNLSFMLVRDVTEAEGVHDKAVHTFRYAYRVSDGNASLADISRAAEEFNEPFIVAQRVGDTTSVKLPFSQESQDETGLR
jgi:hypothetical protein